jgi:hypothetical protein
MKKLIALVLAATVVLLVPTGAAIAGDRDVIQEGSCARSTDWKLKVSPEDGRLEVEFEVDQNVRGDRWRVRIRHDGDLVFRGVRTTRGPSGSFEVRIVENNRAGADQFRGKAVNLATGERCLGMATF